MSENHSVPLIIGHRGAAAVAPENTPASFRQAINDGAEGLEFDVRLSGNGVPTVFHDASLHRICNQKLRVADLAVEDLQNLDAGSWFNERFPKKADADFADETIPTLEETLRLLKDYGGLIYVELKCLNSEIAPLTEAVAEIIRDSKLFPQIIVKSFKLKAILQTKLRLPEIRTAALFAPQILTMLRKKSRLVGEARKYEADELSLHYSLANPKIVEQAAEAGMQSIIWTADRPVWVKRAREIGLKAVITNNPARLLAARREEFGE